MIFDPQNQEYSACVRWHTDDSHFYEKGVKLGMDGSVTRGIWINGNFDCQVELSNKTDFLNWSNNLRLVSDQWQSFGESNSDHKLEGRGIFINKGGSILIGHFSENAPVLGEYIQISAFGEFSVGESALDSDGRQIFKGKNYKPHKKWYY